MISVSFSWGFSPPLFWWKGSELSGLTAQMSSLFRAKDEEALSKEAPAPAAPAQLPWGTKS